MSGRFRQLANRRFSVARLGGFVTWRPQRVSLTLFAVRPVSLAGVIHGGRILPGFAHVAEGRLHQDRGPELITPDCRFPAVFRRPQIDIKDHQRMA